MCRTMAGPWCLVHGPWSVLGCWSVPGPWSLVPGQQDRGQRTKNGLRTRDGPWTKNQGPGTDQQPPERSPAARSYRTTSHPVGANFDPFGSFLNVELTRRGLPPSSIDVMTVM